MIKTRLSSESRRMCARCPGKPAVQVRITVEQAKGPRYSARRPECSDCAKKPGGVVIRL